VREMQGLGTVDELTRLYVSYVAGSEGLTHDSLHKRLSKGGGQVDQFINEMLVEKDGNRIRVTPPEERFEYVQSKIQRGKDVHVIDGVHYLYYLYKEGKPIAKHLEDLGAEEIKRTCELLYRKVGDEVYAKIAGILGVAKKVEKMPKLDDFMEA